MYSWCCLAVKYMAVKSGNMGRKDPVYTASLTFAEGLLVSAVDAKCASVIFLSTVAHNSSLSGTKGRELFSNFIMKTGV